jgi:hypothetical protein
VIDPGVRGRFLIPLLPEGGPPRGGAAKVSSTRCVDRQARGWGSTETLQRCYQEPGDATILAVVLGGAELREVEA